MITPFDLEAGVKGHIQHLRKDYQTMTSYKLFSHYKPVGAKVRELEV